LKRAYRSREKNAIQKGDIRVWADNDNNPFRIWRNKYASVIEETELQWRENRSLE